MEYNRNTSMSSIHNVVVALNEGGVLTCDALMNRLWNDASAGQQARKITAARNSANHTEGYARQQLRQEIRRSLYTHFNDTELLGLHIFRATPVGSAEVFWVVEEQELPTEENTAPDRVSFDTPGDAGIPVPAELGVDASLIERLVAANNSSIPTSDLLRASADNSFVNTDMPAEMCTLLTEDFSEFYDTDIKGSALTARVNELICNLEAAGE